MSSETNSGGPAEPPDKGTGRRHVPPYDPDLSLISYWEEPLTEPAQQDLAGEQRVPPYDPDPALITYWEESRRRRDRTARK